MSGPKALTCSAFKAALNTIFKLQNRILSQMRRLEKLQYMDKRTALSLDCSDFVAEQRKRVEKLCATYRPSYRGTGREMRTIAQKTEDLERFLKKASQAETAYKKKEADYEAYADYVQYIEASCVAIEAYKNSTLGFIEKSVAGSKGEDAVRKIKAVAFDIKAEKYFSGFMQQESELKDKVRNAVDEVQASVDEVRVGVLDAALGEWDSVGTDHSVIENAKSDPLQKEQYQKRQELLSQIQLFIQNIEDRQLQDIYNEKLEKLICSNTFRDPYFYAELLEELKKNEENRLYRQELQDMLHMLDETSFPDFVQTKCGALRQMIAAQLDQSRITEADMDEMREAQQELFEEKERVEEELALKRRQQLFLKENLVQGLESLGYKVVTDTRVVDFENVDDFVLDIPEQDNYLNIRFAKGKNDFLYNFLIPEKKDSLDVGQTKQKLEEMHTACDDFKQALRELVDLGVECEITRDIPISEEAMIRIPDALRARLLKQTTKQENLLRTKYLDQE